jgi:hypothetical protein
MTTQNKTATKPTRTDNQKSQHRKKDPLKEYDNPK